MSFHYTRPPDMVHSYRFSGMTEERKKSIQRKTRERQERQGKTVVKLHSDPPGERTSFCNGDLLDFLQDNGRWPTKIVTARHPKTKRYGFQMFHEGEWKMIWLNTEHDPKAEGQYLA